MARVSKDLIRYSEQRRKPKTRRRGCSRSKR